MVHGYEVDIFYCPNGRFQAAAGIPAYEWRLLHHYDGIVTRAALSRVTGISQKLIGHYLTGYRTPRPARRQQIIDGLHRLGEELLAAH